MRVFVAIKISDGLANKILEWEKKYFNLPVRWLSKENLHITLIPPWYEKDIKNIKIKLQNIEKVGEFEINFEKVSLGPSPKHPRLIWAEGKAPEKFIRLCKNLEEITGQSYDHSDELLHITLARFKEEGFKDFTVKSLDEKVSWRDRVESIVLFESKTLRTGAEYKILEEIELKS